MRSVFDADRAAVLVIDGKHVPALRVWLPGQVYSEEVRPQPHHVMNVMCRNMPIQHDGQHYIVFTNTVEWDDQHMLSFDARSDADAFWMAYAQVQLQAACAAPINEKIVLYRIDGVLRSDPYTPYEQSWNLYDSSFDDEPYHPECEVCHRRVGTLYYLSDSGREACPDDVDIRGEA